VHLLGHRDDVADLLAAADLFAMPSLFEGLPLAVLEAMFAGTPVVASAVGGIPEAVRDGLEGRLVPAGAVGPLSEVLAELLSDADRRAALGKAARQRAESEFTISHMADAYERLYTGAR
jgi:glycosyltransferase involved in cell wall biosynthesis